LTTASKKWQLPHKKEKILNPISQINSKEEYPARENSKNYLSNHKFHKPQIECNAKTLLPSLKSKSSKLKHKLPLIQRILATKQCMNKRREFQKTIYATRREIKKNTNCNYNTVHSAFQY